MKRLPTPYKSLGFLYALLLLSLILTIPAYSFEKVSLKKYKSEALKADNPVNLTRLSLQKTYQINSPDYVLQFFFSGPNILGFLLKRDRSKPLFVRWCFFRNCEESPRDFVSVIAQPNRPPLADDFFKINHPRGMNYRFQGLHFFTRR